MSQPTQPHQASSSSHSSSSEPSACPAARSRPVCSPPVPSRVRILSLLRSDAGSMRISSLNIVLYIGSLLLIGAAGLLSPSVTSSQDETAIFPCPARRLSSRLSRSWSAHLPFVERLRIASYSLQQPNLAFIPLTGVAIYVLKIWTEGRHMAPHVSGWHCSHCWSLRLM